MVQTKLKIQPQYTTYNNNGATFIEAGSIYVLPPPHSPVPLYRYPWTLVGNPKFP